MSDTMLQLRQIVKDLRRAIEALDTIVQTSEEFSLGDDPGTAKQQALQEVYDDIVKNLKVSTDYEMSGAELNYRCSKYRKLSTVEKRVVLKNMTMHGTISTNMVANGRKPATIIRLMEKSPLPDNRAKSKQTEPRNLDY